MTVKARIIELRDGSFTCPIYGRCGLRSSRVAHILREGVPEDVLLDEDLEPIVGQPVGPGGQGYSAVQAAIRYCEREENIVWRRIRGERRLACLGPMARVDAAQGYIRTSGRAAQRSMRIAAGTDRKGLDTATVNKLNAYQVIASLNVETTKPSTMRAIAARNITAENGSRILAAFLTKEGD